MNNKSYSYSFRKPTRNKGLASDTMVHKHWLACPSVLAAKWAFFNLVGKNKANKETRFGPNVTRAVNGLRLSVLQTRDSSEQFKCTTPGIHESRVISSRRKLCQWSQPERRADATFRMISYDKRFYCEVHFYKMRKTTNVQGTRSNQQAGFTSIDYFFLTTLTSGTPQYLPGQQTDYLLHAQDIRTCSCSIFQLWLFREIPN